MDLKVERRAVEEVIISSGDFPVGMEAFPAADEDQFEFIKTVIDTCDYYVLIIAGRYGSLATDGMSYTEKEYRYAVSRQVPILVMVHHDRGIIEKSKSETEETKSKQLESFIIEASQGRIRKEWHSVDSLKLAVREALDHAKATRPRTGWVRGDSIASVEALAELNQLRKENEKFKEAIGELQISFELPEFPNPSEKIIIGVGLSNKNTQFGFGAVEIECTWISVFPYFFSNLDWRTNDWNGEVFYRINEEMSCIKIGSFLASDVGNLDVGMSFMISNVMLETLKSYYIEAGFMRPEGAGEPFTEIGKKYARRQLVTAQKGDSAISLVSGQFVFAKEDATDQDIPF